MTRHWSPPLGAWEPSPICALPVLCIWCGQDGEGVGLEVEGLVWGWKGWFRSGRTGLEMRGLNKGWEKEKERVEKEEETYSCRILLSVVCGYPKSMSSSRSS